MSERARDAAARLAAQTEFGRPLVLEAGAGTGKTASSRSGRSKTVAARSR